MSRAICFIISAVILASGISGCKTTESSDKEAYTSMESCITLDELRKDLNKQRQQEVMEPLKHTADEYGKIEKDDVEDFSDSDIQNLVERQQYKGELTLEGALEDVDTLMKILKTSYGAYNYFGGDERFGQAKEKITQRVIDNYGQGPVSTGDFHKILLEELSFLEDSHFMIGRMNPEFKEKVIFCDSKKRDFRKDDNGYFTVIDKDKCYVPADDEKYLHLTVSNDNVLIYGLFALAEDNPSLPQRLTLKAESGKECTIDVAWDTVDAGKPAEDVQVYKSYEKDGIPVIALGMMTMSDANIGKTKEFIDEAKELRDKKAFILDLRGNRGGIADINGLFLFNLTGAYCEPKMQSVKRYSALNLYHRDVMNRELAKSIGQASGNHVKEQLESHYKNGETVVTDHKAKWSKYDHSIIVLIDKNTVSAGEYLLFQLATVENVIFMGTNSNGCLVAGDVNALSTIYLSHSGLDVNYGQTLSITDKVDGFDTDGWMPDIITCGDALDAAVALINGKQ